MEPTSSDQQKQSAQPANATSTGPNVPTGEWPGAFGIYKHSKAAVMLNLSAVLVLVIVSTLLSAINSPKNDSILDLVFGVASVFVSMTLLFVYLAGVRGDKLDMGAALRKAADPILFLKFIGLMILVGLSIVAGLILLIVPGLILIGRLSLAPYYLVDKNEGVLEAYKASWEDTRGHAMKVWGIIGASIGMALLIIVLVGIYFLIMYGAALAVLYQYILKRSSVKATAATPAPPPEV